MNSGFVSLVGAGPGHADLLSVKALRRIQQASVILYDSLISEEIKSLFPKKASALHVGKRCGRHSFTQDHINRWIIHFARQGNYVVRLKGGDPLVFGRGSEEASALNKAGITYEIVPGISAFSGIGTLNGIPMTHRGVSRSVLLIEGHTLKKTPPDWHWLAKFKGTLVIYMGVTNVQWIATQLIASGAKGETPIALVETDAEQKQHTSQSTLKTVSRLGLIPKTQGPGIIYIGSVVDISNQILSKGDNHVTAVANFS